MGSFQNLFEGLSRGVQHLSLHRVVEPERTRSDNRALAGADALGTVDGNFDWVALCPGRIHISV
jgi:hypothetical protein